MKEHLDFRERLYTIDKKGKRLWLHPSVIKGAFRRKRIIVAWILILVYVLAPWITVGGEQAVLLDLVSRKFTFFGATFWATDTIFLALILGALAFSLFFFSAVFGRIWCGWACPETVFLEFVFRPLETLIEGRPSERKKLDKGSWTTTKIRKKIIKYSIYSVIAWILSNTALAYFLGREPLIEMIQHSPAENLEMFALSLALMAALLFQFGWFREQFCTVLCPYARFQSVLLDTDSLVVGYDTNRGEIRGKDGPGDCIDCGLCVRVCPTGIDIRNGLQLECIHCAACVDACDSIMRSLGRAPGLIRYCTENQLKGIKGRFLRPRVAIYSAIIIAYASFFIYFLVSRESSEFEIIRASKGNAPFTEIEGGMISNLVTIHISNKGNKEETYTVRIISPYGVSAVLPTDKFKVRGGELGTLPIFVRFPRSLLVSGEVGAVFEVTNTSGFKNEKAFTLIGPR